MLRMPFQTYNNAWLASKPDASFHRQSLLNQLDTPGAGYTGVRAAGLVLRGESPE